MKRDNRKTGLGRGLSTLLAETSFENEVSTTKRPSSEIELTDLTVPIEMLSPSANQPRKVFNESKLVELADSIKQNGLIQPIIVRKVKSGYEIVAGERRWRASQLAQKHVVPIVVREISDRAAIEYGLVENIQREDLNIIEEAKGYKRLSEEFGYDQDKIAAMMSRSRSHVSNTLRLLNLPKDVIAMIEQGELTAGQARPLIGMPNASSIAEEIVAKRLSARSIENIKKKNSKSFTIDPNIFDAQRDIERSIGLKVHIQNKKNNSGKISIEYKNLDQLELISTLLKNKSKN